MKLNKLIHINLNQTVSKFEMLEIQKERNRWYIFSLIIFIFSAILIFDFYLLNRYNHLISSRLEKANSLFSEAQEIRKKYESYNIDISISQDDINQLYSIESNRISLANKLQLISKLIPQDMSLENLRYSHSGNKINLMLLVDGDDQDYQKNRDILTENITKIKNLNQNFGVFGDNDFGGYEIEREAGKNKDQKYYKVELILSK